MVSYCPCLVETRDSTQRSTLDKKTEEHFLTVMIKFGKLYHSLEKFSFPLFQPLKILKLHYKMKTTFMQSNFKQIPTKSLEPISGSFL